MSIRIINNRIEGTRITVWDVYLYQVKHYPRETICSYLSINSEELAAAEHFIAANAEYVEKIHQQIEERNRRGNPPELQAKLDAGHARFMERVRRTWQDKGLEMPHERNGS